MDADKEEFPDQGELYDVVRDKNGNAIVIPDEIREKLQQSMSGLFEAYRQLSEIDSLADPDELISILEAIANEKPEKADVLAPLPNTELVNFYIRFLNTGTKGNMVSTLNRDEKIEYFPWSDSTEIKKTKKISRKNSKGDIEKEDNYISLTVSDMDAFSGISIDSGTLIYVLQNVATQYFPKEVRIDLWDMRKKFDFSRTSKAYTAIDRFYTRQLKIVFNGCIYVKGRKNPERLKSPLFTEFQASSDGRYVSLKLSEKFNVFFLSQYYTYFPQYGYRLNKNGRSLLQYIFSQARQNTDTIKAGKSYRISYEAIRIHLGLEYDRVKDRKYKQRLLDPIEAAISEIQAAVKEYDADDSLLFVITPWRHKAGMSALDQIKKGYIEVSLQGKYADRFISIADSREEKLKAIADAEKKKKDAESVPDQAEESSK